MSPRFETLAVHGGLREDETRARALPVHRTTAYTFKDLAHAQDLFNLKAAGHIYSRMSNPTQEALEERAALLDGGAAALALSSGTSAVFYSFINLARQGDEILSANNLYGGTFTMLDNILPQFGISARFVRPNDLKAAEAAVNSRTRCVYVETIGNPTLDVADISAYAELAHAHGLPLLVDATFSTPALQRPLEQGADIVIHSATKWMGGHGTALGGIVVEGKGFDWTDPRFALYNEPDSGYHGIRWGRDLGGLPPFLTRMRTVPLRNLGACISPDNAWIILQGLETLPVRMQRHSENAMKVARYLAGHPKAAWVRYPGLPSDPDHALALKYLSGGFGGMVVFGVPGRGEAGRANGARFIEALRLFSHLANVGDAKSLALHPAGTTHSQLSEEQKDDSGVLPEMIRLSIGLEHPDDILEDLEQALAAVQG